MNATGGIGIRLIPFYIVSFVVLGAFMPYWPLWLEDRGVTKVEIGWMLGAGVWVRLLAPWIAQWIDERHVHRRATIGLLVTSAALFALFAFTDGFVPLFALCVAFSAGWMMIYPLVDTLASSVVGRHYGRLRLWGSASFMVTSAVVGTLLEDSPVAIVYWIVLGALVASILVGFGLPDPDHDAPSPAASRESRTRPIGTLLRDRQFLLIAVGTGLVQGSHAGVYTFGSLHWRDSGIPEPTIGQLWAIGVIAEILLFTQSARICALLGPVRLAALGGIGALIRWATLASTTETVPLFAAQTLHALSFGATHLALVAYVGERVPAGLRVTAQTIYTAVGMGLVMGTATVVAGPLFESHGGAMFWLMFGTTALGTVAIAAVRTTRG